MNPWEAVLLAIGGNAVALAVLGILAKSLLEKLIVRDTKVFESDLKAKADAEIERLKSEMTRNLESYKIQLKKSEFFFQREYEAAIEFASIASEINPRHTRPDMEWEDAMGHVIDHYERSVARLDAFLTRQSPVLNEKERAVLKKAISSANDGRFYSEVQGNPSAYEDAAKFLDEINGLHDSLIARLRSQASL